jgi:hypothetical protein
MYGEKGDTCKMMLMVSENDLSNYYETARTDIFTVETFDIGTVWCCNRNIKNFSNSEKNVSGAEFVEDRTKKQSRL